MRQVIESAAESGDGVCIGGNNTTRRQTQTQNSHEKQSTHSRRASIHRWRQVFFAWRCCTDLKNVAVFYGKWAGGVAGGKSWDRAAYDAGKEANIPGMGDNNPEK